MRCMRWMLVCVVALAAGCGGGGGGTGSGDDGGGSGGPPVPDNFPPMSIVEPFDTTTNRDAGETTADWNNVAIEAGVLRSIPVTSRTATIFGYTFANNGVTSGRGQYRPENQLLMGNDFAQANPNLDPAAALGRRMQMAFSSAEIGAAGTITAVEWGPDRNATVAATYSNVRLRLGYQAQDAMDLTASLTGNFDGAPTQVYSGPYSVAATTNVGNTANEPVGTHVGGYAENPGCNAGGTWNQPLFDFTGFYAWPTPSATFDWDPAYASGAVLLFDASVTLGTATQTIRSWAARTFPCSGILIGGFPERVARSTYEGAGANPADNFQAGILNPEPAVCDTRFTLTTLRSIGVSLFFEGAYGTNNDFDSASLLPSTQQDSASVLVEYQGAQAVQADRRTIDESLAFTPWTTNANDCDGFRYIRFRITLRADASTLAPARVDRIVIPVTEATP